MPNNQAHDPRVSTAGERVAQAVGLSVAAVASGGGSSNITDNGDGTITISGAGFGTKTQQTERLFDRAAFVRENGTESTLRAGVSEGYAVVSTSSNADEIYGSATDVRVTKGSGSRALRTATVPGQYYTDQMSGEGWLENPKIAPPDGAFQPKVFLSWHEKHRYDFLTQQRATVSGVSGSFTAATKSGGTITEGDEVTIDDGVNQVTGQLIEFATGTDGVRLITPTFSSALSGTITTPATMTGPTGSCTVDSLSYLSPIDTEKVLRMRSGGTDFFNLTFNPTRVAIEGNDASLGRYDGDVTQWVKDKWAFFVMKLDFENGTANLYANGALVNSQPVGTSPDANYDQVNAVTIASMGFQAIRSFAQEVDFSDVYLDYSFNCVFIGDAEQWQNCTKIEQQYIDGWSDTSVTASLDLGDIALADAYVFVTDKGVPDPTDTGVKI